MNLVGEWGACLARALADGDVRDVVVSPGSRSTPLVVACAAEPRIALHLVLDERAAAFFALGRARVEDRPVALICTSGTAAANYLPAVIEADESRVPLVVVTADRPASLMNCGANQTIEQLSLFVGRTRFTADLGEPRPTEAAFRGLRRTVTRAVGSAAGPEPGPVHLDARFDKPLEPGPAVTADDFAAEVAAAAVRHPEPARREPARRAPTAAVVERIVAALRRSKRPVIVAGPQLPRLAGLREPVFELARRGRIPLLAEATSQLRFAGQRRRGVPTFDMFSLAYRAPVARAALGPDFILQLGAYPVSRGYEELLRSGPVARFVLADHGWPDPVGDATEVVVADVGEVLRAVLEGLGEARRDEAFLSALRGADEALRQSVEGLLGTEPFGEASVARAVVAGLGAGATLVVGNSLPVRQLSLVCPGELADVTVVSQRGVSGIDGLIAGAAGAASATSGPTLLYLGDVSFLHDVGGLLAARGLASPFVIVVSNNDGGRIFEQLPVAAADLDPEVVALFTTPHGLTFGPAAALYGHRYVAVSDAAALRRAIDDGLGRPGCTVIEAAVPPSAAARESSWLLGAAATALSGVVGAVPSNDAGSPGR